MSDRTSFTHALIRVRAPVRVFGLAVATAGPRTLLGQSNLIHHTLARGFAPKPGKAWEEAERQARAALAFNLAAHHKVLLKTISESTSSMSQKLSESKAEITLTDVTIIRHGYSHASQSFYALAQMPTPAGRVNTGN